MNPNIRADGGLQDPKYIAKNFYSYQCKIDSAFAPATSQTKSFTIDGDSDFFWTKLACHAVVGDDATTIDVEELPEVNVVITNTTSGRQYMSEAVPLANVAGSARLPFILPMITYFAAKSTISVLFSNASDNQTYSDLYLTFLGIKAFTNQR